MLLCAPSPFCAVLRCTDLCCSFQPQVRKEVEDAELQECTFKPKTGRPPSPARVRPNVPVYDRLYQAKPNWEQKRWV